MLPHNAVTAISQEVIIEVKLPSDRFYDEGNADYLRFGNVKFKNQ